MSSRTVVAIVSSLLTLAVLVGLSKAVEGPSRTLVGWIGGSFGSVGLGVFVIGIPLLGGIATYILHRRDQRRRYAATGIIDIEKPHPWPMWVRVLAFWPVGLAVIGIVGVIVFEGRG